MHVPVAQLPDAFAGVQAAPHEPQFASVLSEASQPLSGSVSQLAKPASQTPSVHVPPGHDSVALARSQLTPQPPQFVSEVSAVSQPFDASASQLP